MAWEILECKLSATSSGGQTTDTTEGDRVLYDSIEDAVASFEADVAPTSIDSIGTRPTGPNRCAVVIVYTE